MKSKSKVGIRHVAEALEKPLLLWHRLSLSYSTYLKKAGQILNTWYDDDNDNDDDIFTSFTTHPNNLISFTPANIPCLSFLFVLPPWPPPAKLQAVMHSLLMTWVIQVTANTAKATLFWYCINRPPLNNIEYLICHRGFWQHSRVKGASLSWCRIPHAGPTESLLSQRKDIQ